MADMGTEFADLKRRVMALEADPNVIAAQTDAKQIFADGLARVTEALEAHRAILDDVIKGFASKGQLTELGKKLMAQAEALVAAHKGEVEAALKTLAAQLAAEIENVATARPAAAVSTSTVSLPATASVSTSEPPVPSA